MPMRASSFGFESVDAAMKIEKEKSVNFISLNGVWKFNWVKNPNDRPKDFYKVDFDDSKWDNFKVPANWEVNGYGTPIYINHGYEFAGKTNMGGKMNPPFDIPENNNPVGSYRRKVIVPNNWDGRQVFIHLGAVKSAFFIYVNGKKVGYSEDSKMAAEFDITKWVRSGENTIALQVYRWSDGSYLECQDMFRISGIERDVYLYSTPKINIRDFSLETTLTNGYKDGKFGVNAEVSSYKIDKETLHSIPDSFKVAVQIKDVDGKVIFSDRSQKFETVLGNYKTNVSLGGVIPNVKSWSAEIPNLYDLYITLEDSKGRVVEVVPQKIGFRTIEIKDNNVLVNGQRVFFKGVNRHEHHPITGHTLTREDMRKEIEMMKKLNINAIRFSHYPPDPYFLELCDRYGFYIVDEANIESHGRYYDLEYTFANDKVWFNPHFERVRRMYERDKNHAAVLFWSLGNEAGNGTNFYACYDWLKKTDKMRPVQYERAEEDYNTDIIVPQYPDPDWLVEYAKSNPSRPLIMSEYAHIMGNSLGNFKEYWDAIESYPNLQGGFIWEWIDQGIDTVKNGKRILAYGGDFPLDQPTDNNFSDNNFCVKGVVTGYRGYTPMSREVMKVHQNIKTKAIDAQKGALTVTNAFFFRDLSNFTLCWAIVENGKTVEKGVVADINTAPRTTKAVAIPFKTSLDPTKEYFINVSYVLKNAEAFSDAGFVQAYEQIPIITPLRAVDVKPTGKLIITKTDKQLIAEGKNFKATFDLVNGTLLSYMVKGVQILNNGPKPNFWRAPTDNDMGAGFNKSLRMWRGAYDKGALVSADVKKISDSQYAVTFKKNVVDGDALAEQTFTIDGNGNIKVDNRFNAIKGTYETMYRIGNAMELNREFDTITWYGRGPWENYWDRKESATVGIYKQKLSDQYFAYARPQESGNKSDVRWVTLINAKGTGIKIEGEGLVNFSALPFDMNALDPELNKKQYHSGELAESTSINLNIDFQQLGVQGIDSWGSKPLKKYLLPFHTYEYTYWIKPLL